MSTDAGDSGIAPEEFVQPDHRLFIDTNVFMDSAAGLKQLFERCKDAAVQNGNGIVVPTKVVDELTKQSQLVRTEFTDAREAARRQRAGKWLPLLDSLGALGVVRKDLGDGSNPYADDLFVDLFTRFGGTYSMCLLTNDITLRLRIRLLAAHSDRRLIAGTVSPDGRIMVDSDQDLYGRGVRKLSRIRGRVEDGTGTRKDRHEVEMLAPLLDEFQKTFGLEVAPPRTASARRAFRHTTTMEPKDQPLTDTAIPSVGDRVTAGSPAGRRSLVLGELLGEGGEGRVFAVEGDDKLVVKIFDQDHRTRHRIEKVRRLLSHNLASPGIAFPSSVITNDDGDEVGYAMPRAAGEVLQQTIMRPARFKKTYPNWTKADLVDVCVSFLEKVEYLHSLNILVGDINPKNLMVTEGKDVWIIDADSWQLEGYPCPVGTPMFTAPTITGDYSEALRTMEEELFAVATMLFMILITGQNPYARAGADGGDYPGLIKEGQFAFQFQGNSKGDQPGGNWKYMWSHLPVRVKATFWNTFHREGDRYERRPTATEWLGIFREYQQFFGGTDDFDPMSSDVYPTRYRARNRETRIYECATCHTSLAGRWQEDRKEYWEPELCEGCYRNLPRCGDCGRPKPPGSLHDGRCWPCTRIRDEELDPSRLCRDCRQPFITFKHARWFLSKGMEIPKSHERATKEPCPPRPPRAARQPSPKASRTRPATNPGASKTPASTRRQQRKSSWAKFLDWLKP